MLNTCASTSNIYYFNCQNQTPSIIYSYFPQAFINLDYQIKVQDTVNNYYEAIKRTKITNKKNGIEREYILMQVSFNFKSNQSQIKQFFVKEINNKKKLKELTKEQKEIYEKDVFSLQEKMLFYCNPQFKGR